MNRESDNVGIMTKEEKSSNLFMWMDKKLKLHELHIKNNQSGWKVQRGSIYTCYLGENIGFEKGVSTQSRPVLVVSSDDLNRKSGNVVIVPLSKNIKWKDVSKKTLQYQSHYVLYKSKYKKLEHNSAIQCEDVRVVSKSRLGSLICFIDKPDMSKISKRLKYTFQI